MNTSSRNHYNNPNAIQVKALYDYVPDTSFEGTFLSFNTGDVITVTEKCEGGWYKGVLNNIEGLFPPTYCEELPPRRVLNVDTKKTSPSIKRMQTLLKLTVTGTGEKVEEVEQEEDGDYFTRERAQSDANVFAGRAKPSLRIVAERVIEGKRLLESRMAGQTEDKGEETEKKEEKEEDKTKENGQPARPAGQIAEPVVKDKPSEILEFLALQKRISDLEAEKVAIVEEFRTGKEKLQEEFSQKITLLNDLLDEKGLIIEIMKKDLEIKAEENKEITIELELEIERLTRSCAELEEQVIHLTPLEGELTSPRDERALPAAPNHPNPPTPRVRASRSPPASPPTRLSLTSSSSLSFSAASPSSPNPISLSSSASTLSFFSSSPSRRRRSATAPPPPASQEIPENSSLTTSSEKSDASTLSSSSVSTDTTPPSPLEKSTSEVPEIKVSTSELVVVPPLSLPGSQISHLKNFGAHSNPHQPPQRYNSLPTLSPLPKEGLRGPVSPRTTSLTPRATNSPRVLFSSTLLDSQSLSRSSKIPNFEVSLAKLAEMGPDPPPAELSIPSDPALAALEISELKKRIIELEADRLQMIAEYRSKKSEPGSESSGPTSSPLKISVSAARANTPPLPLPPIQVSLTKSGTLPPLPPTPTLPPPSFSNSPFSPPSPSPSLPPSPLSSSSQSTPKSAQDPPTSSPVRLMRRNGKGPNPATGPSAGPTSGPNSDIERSYKAQSQNLTWIQASVCVAVGSAAFYLIQTLVLRYYA